jgi:aerobic carbon-monoxide dehydrogenase medium subunit
MYPLDICLPQTLAEAVELARDEDSQIMSGGQTLIPTLKARLAAPARLISLRQIAQMTGLRTDEGQMCIGAGTTHATVAREAAAHYPGLARLAANIGDPAVRNRGTIGGSLANNDPSACYPAAALASGATIVTCTREIAADDYFQGMFQTALDPGEIVTQVRFPIPLAAHYIKFRQRASRFALTGVFVARFADGVRVAVTGASESGVFRWHEAEAALALTFTPATVDALDPPSVRMISDLHGSAEYRADLTRVLTADAIRAILI